MHGLLRSAAEVAALAFQEREQADAALLSAEPGDPNYQALWEKREVARGEELHCLRMLLLAAEGVMAQERGRIGDALQASIVVSRSLRKRP